MTRILIANRGEIAIRIARAAAELNLRSVAVYSAEDARSLHVARADEAHGLEGGAAAYLDGAQLIAVARAAGCAAIHPGYGFLSENAQFARQCAQAGIIFVGPRPEVLALFGDKAQARALAQRCGVPLPEGSDGPVALEQARDFFQAHGPLLIKAVAGGGGRGIRPVLHAGELDEAYARCRSEARAAFGNDAVYVERLIARARHIEVQVVGDGKGHIAHLGERECTLQRRRQKLVEIAPSPSLSAAQRERITAAAMTMATAAHYDNLGTFEFLLDESAGDSDAFVFIEANPRLQVEHTVTEAVTGIDLVQTQLQLALGRSLGELGLTQDDIPAARGYAVQLRINMESLDANGEARPACGTLTVFEPPSGPGVRVDTFGYAGYATNPQFDSLLAKLIVHSSSAQFGAALAKTARALDEFRIEGVATTQGLLRNLLHHPDVRANRVDTRFVENHASELSAPPPTRRFFESALAEAATPDRAEPGVTAPMAGRIAAIEVSAGAVVRRGQALLVLEAMKMEHCIEAAEDGVVRSLAVHPGAIVREGQTLLVIEAAAVQGDAEAGAVAVDLDAIRPDLAEVLARHAATLDAARPAAVARRHAGGQRSARENIDDLCDPDSFVEYGALALAAQRHRRTPEELIAISPADGMVMGIGAVNGEHFAEDARCAVLAYDYTVFAGTQGALNHKKKDRLFQLARQWRLPVIAFAEGGGGRPGDDWGSPSALDIATFAEFAGLSALVPLIGIVNGRCFAGNAALAGCCDVIIATRNTNLGMGGPAMIEGGGLGVFPPEAIGPIAVQAPNGVVDVVVADEAEAVRVAKRYLGYFQGRLEHWNCADQRLLRASIPENRVRAYDIRSVIATLADTDSVLELRAAFGVGTITALIRVEGRPLGVIANNPLHLGGAIDADGADKAARFIQLCDAFDIPLLALCDTPGFMVGPEVEKSAQVRHVSRLFVTAASATIPLFAIVLRKAYGLGAQAMTGGSFRAPVFTVAWPTGEFGAMGLEGAVRLGYRKELEAIADPAEREARYQAMVADAYAQGKGLNSASYLELDAVIDPAESRRWLARGMASLPPVSKRGGKKRPCIDTW